MVKATVGSLVSRTRSRGDKRYQVLGTPKDEKEFTELIIDFYNKKYPEVRNMLKYPLYTAYEKPVEVEETATRVPEEIKRRRYSVHSSDLESALSMALFSDVGATMDISGPTLQNLLNFLEVLKLYFPEELKQAKTNILKLYQWVYKNNTPPTRMSGKSFASEVERIWGKPCEKYVACKGSKPTYGYYPCGIWTMWHVLTVQYYLKNQNKSASQKQNRKVLHAMVGYMGSFFGCRACSEHFFKMTKNGTLVDKEVQSAADTVLFLWEKHNVVNLRLTSSKTNDPVFPKQVFPNVDYCRKCYKHPEKAPKVDSDETRQLIEVAKNMNTFDTTPFNKNEVLKFLVEQFKNVETNRDDSSIVRTIKDSPPLEINLSLETEIVKRR